MDTIIREIFSQYQIRKTKRQKTAFIEYTQKKAQELGYEARVEKGMLGVRNIVVGDPERAKVVYTAHYDTCARLPFPNFLTPKHIGIYLLYTLAVVLGFMLASFVIGVVLGLIGAVLHWSEAVAVTAAELAYFGFLFCLMFGPANKHTANDNTSGVTVLFGIMKALPPEQREAAAFVFFDQEENGLIGSSAFAAKHKRIKKSTPVVNFDCVSDGQEILIVTKKAALGYRPLLEAAFAEGGDVSVEVTGRAFYPSDQASFKRGIGVAAFKKTKRGILYMDRIHTDKDTVYRRENIDFLIDGALKLCALLP